MVYNIIREPFGSLLIFIKNNDIIYIENKEREKLKNEMVEKA